MMEQGMKYHISPDAKGYFNGAETLTVIRRSGSIVQFSLGEGKTKGYGSMPLEHLFYLLKRSELTEAMNKRQQLALSEDTEQIS
ncbi:hypothetical protein SAMN05421736_12368 [Evansella caseinilytica]|uniref:Uncharacterized protein n=1 Tax=Evansella caseinilytica TaxID=1503961 RepID=A0A1H3UMQ8_9BACI|nr:hypothetical protein [Evansella caseinilytica]SDZ63637.1 hypothetical protein SAMN05421736_12368 [Evansella caseinilytica]